MDNFLFNKHTLRNNCLFHFSGNSCNCLPNPIILHCPVSIRSINHLHFHGSACFIFHFMDFIYGRPWAINLFD